MTSMDLVALTLVKMATDHGAQQQECGETGRAPLVNWTELVEAMREALPDVPEAALTEIGAALGKWSSTMYHVGKALAEGRETYEDGRRVGAAEEKASKAKEAWLMGLLAVCAEQDQAGGTPEFLDIDTGDLKPGEQAWLEQQVQAVVDAEQQFGRDAAVTLALKNMEAAPTARLAAALAEALHRDHRITIPGSM